MAVVMKKTDPIQTCKGNIQRSLLGIIRGSKAIAQAGANNLFVYINKLNRPAKIKRATRHSGIPQ